MIQGAATRPTSDGATPTLGLVLEDTVEVVMWPRDEIAIAPVTLSAIPVKIRITLAFSRGSISAQYCLTSKMSHDGSWRAACLIRFWIQSFHFEAPEEARGVTVPGVGSGALFGLFHPPGM